MSQPTRMNVRQLAAEAGIAAREAVAALRAAGVRVGTPSQVFEGAELKDVRLKLGLLARRRPPSEPARRLTHDELVVQVLRPLRTKGKVGRNHTTPIENTYGHGVPAHQKDEARELVEELLRTGALEEKVSQGRRHVWLTNKGLARLEAAESAGGAAATG
jgi:hypothetical protein